MGSDPFDDLLDVPEEPYYSHQTLSQIRAFLKSRNRRRWNRLESDFKWLQDEMKKIGLNPDDARFLL
jgi:hypothetical protein